MLHPDDTTYFARLHAIGLRAAEAAGVKVLVIDAKKRPATGDGVAYLKERRISIAVRGKQCAYAGGEWSKRRHSHAYNLHTLAHELAHIHEYQDHGDSWHGPRFRVYEQALLEIVNRLDAEVQP